MREQLVFPCDRPEMPRADDAFAPRQVAGEIGDSVELLRKKCKRRRVENVDKAPSGCTSPMAKGVKPAAPVLTWSSPLSGGSIAK